MLLSASLLAVLLSAAPAVTAPVTVTKVAGPDRALRFEVVVPASLDDVWGAFESAEGVQTWLWSTARVDLVPGGDWLVLYPGGKTGGGTVLSVDPKRQLAIAALAPEQFPHVRAERTRAVFGFETVDARHTQVTLVQTGWKSGAEWDEAYEYLADGNAQLLAQLYQRFVSGPIQWK
jgi:uncharacterized protein YndB with AHSA1/START domain